MKKFKQKIQEGFTLVEILIVVVIIGILATVAIPTYFSYVEKAYASDAKTQLKNILMNSKLYAQQTGDVPDDVEEMITAGYMTISESVTLKWEFDISGLTLEDGQVIGTMIATSLKDMGGKEGEEVVYDVTNGKWSGYGQSDSGEGGGDGGGD